MNCKRLADLTARLAQDTRAQLFFVWAALLLSLPPVGVCWLAFVALVPLVRQILNPERPKWLYTHLWICGTLFWLCEAHFVRYPHPVNYVLWGAMACYLGVYFPLFVSVSRIWLYRILPSVFPRLSATTAALFVLPLTWAACDILRYWIFTGYFMSSLCHAFYLWTPFIQTADIVGEWGTTATVVFLGVCLATCVTRQDGKMRPRWMPTLAAALMCAGIFSYGSWRPFQTRTLRCFRATSPPSCLWTKPKFEPPRSSTSGSCGRRYCRPKRKIAPLTCWFSQSQFTVTQ